MLLVALSLVLLLASLYVLSLYVPAVLATGAVATADRNHPTEIARRATCVLAVASVSWLPVAYLVASRGTCEGLTHALLGVHAHSAAPPAAAAVMLVAIFYGGVLALEGRNRVRALRSTTSQQAVASAFDTSQGATVPMLLRNLVVAPLGEEWVFRACTLPLLRVHGHLAPWPAILTAAFAFSLAHAHHHVTLDRSSRLFVTIAHPAACALQMTYTVLFGTFAGALLLRTGSLAAPLAAHVACNALGFPNFDAVIPANPGTQRSLAVGTIVAGIVAFAVAIRPVTSAVHSGWTHLENAGECGSVYLWR